MKKRAQVTSKSEIRRPRQVEKYQSDGGTSMTLQVKILNILKGGQRYQIGHGHALTSPENKNKKSIL